MADFGEELGKINKSLDRVQIMQKGDRQYLRAVLPPKSGDGDKPKRYELSTGYGANSQGLRFGGVAELGYDTGKNTRGEPKMISEILMGNWNISKF